MNQAPSNYFRSNQPEPRQMKKDKLLKLCQQLFPEWSNYSIDDFEFDDPKGFSSFTMGVRASACITPRAVLFRRLEGKDNAILDFETEKAVFLGLGKHQIAPHCYHYDKSCRVEAFYHGRTLTASDLFDSENLRQIANQLYLFHQFTPPDLPHQPFFELLHHKWGALAKEVLLNRISAFPKNEQIMCEELREIYSPATLKQVIECMPDDELTFCHNDTYHGNIMKLESGRIKLLDFEFSCLNNKTYDFSNLFAETVMQHQQTDYPYFRITPPAFGDDELSMLINYYLDNARFGSRQARQQEFSKLLHNTKSMLKMSDYKYAMAALPLALKPVQKIRFIPYALARFRKFKQACSKRVRSECDNSRRSLDEAAMDDAS